MSESLPTGMSEEQFQTLLALMLEKERRCLEREARSRPSLPKSYMSDRFWVSTQAYERQKACNHLKNRGRAHRDYNVSMHRHSTGFWQIKCMYCGWSVWNRPEWSYKWAVGMRMVKQSTNTPTSSEVPAGAAVGIPIGTYTTTLIRDENGNRMFTKWEPTR